MSAIEKAQKWATFEAAFLQKDQTDTSLARLQTLVLDAVAPLVHIMEEGKLTSEMAAEAGKA